MEHYNIVSLDPTDPLAYEVKYNESRVELMATNLGGVGNWNLENCLPNTILSTGNDYKIQLGRRKFTLNYSETEELFILLKLAMRHHKGMREPRLMEIKPIE